MFVNMGFLVTRKTDLDAEGFGYHPTYRLCLVSSV